MFRILSLWKDFEVLAIIPSWSGLCSLAVREDVNLSICSEYYSLTIFLSPDDDHDGSDLCHCGGGDCK